MANLVRKVLSALAGALQLNAEVLVLVDIGCGVYQNDPVQVGEICNVVLRETCGYFKEVIVLGKSDFVKRALKGLESHARVFPEAHKRDSAATGIQAQWRGRQGRISAHTLYQSKEAEMTEAWRDWAATKIQAGVRSFQTRHSLQSDISSNRPNASINCSTMASRVRFDGKNDICERAATCPSPYASPGNVTAHFEQHGDIRHQPTMTSLNTRDAAPNTARTYPKSDVLPAQGDMLPVQEDMLPVQEDNTVARVKLKVLKRLNNLDTDGVRRVLRLDDLGFF
eukprot:GEMP01059514.1.p1 GENE.GEMP01059514.1~~GEMP01059514.1.p1  ORF type:complete len:282 (+),score=90.88 GEMP01059514.1:270-1115(+)